VNEDKDIRCRAAEHGIIAKYDLRHRCRPIMVPYSQDPFPT
jgi:hypothetical protein